MRQRDCWSECSANDEHLSQEVIHIFEIPNVTGEPLEWLL